MNGILHLVCKAICVVGIFALLCLGLMPFGINVFTSDIMMDNMWLPTTIYVLAGLAGILLLIKLVSGNMHHSGWCRSHDEKRPM